MGDGDFHHTEWEIPCSACEQSQKAFMKASMSTGPTLGISSPSGTLSHGAGGKVMCFTRAAESLSITSCRNVGLADSLARPLRIVRLICLVLCRDRFLVVFLFIASILLCHRFNHPLSLIAGSDLYPTQTTPYPSIGRVVSWASQVGKSRLEASLGHSSTLPSREIYPKKQDPFQGPLVKPTFRGLGGFRADSPLAKWQVLKGKRTPVETPGLGRKCTGDLSVQAS